MLEGQSRRSLSGTDTYAVHMYVRAPVGTARRFTTSTEASPHPSCLERSQPACVFRPADQARGPLRHGFVVSTKRACASALPRQRRCWTEPHVSHESGVASYREHGHPREARPTTVCGTSGTLKPWTIPHHLVLAFSVFVVCFVSRSHTLLHLQAVSLSFALPPVCTLPPVTRLHL